MTGWNRGAPRGARGKHGFPRAPVFTSEAWRGCSKPQPTYQLLRWLTSTQERKKKTRRPFNKVKNTIFIGSVTPRQNRTTFLTYPKKTKKKKPQKRKTLFGAEALVWTAWRLIKMRRAARWQNWTPSICLCHLQLSGPGPAGFNKRRRKKKKKKGDRNSYLVMH